jgi:hypothetical protein
MNRQAASHDRPRPGTQWHIERGLVSQFGPAVARGIARTYYFAAGHADTALFTGSAAELTEALARPPMTMAKWARTQSWSQRALASA